MHKGIHYEGSYGYVIAFFANMTLFDFVLYVAVMTFIGYLVNKKTKKSE